jgi:hypothetical protein
MSDPVPQVPAISNFPPAWMRRTWPLSLGLDETSISVWPTLAKFVSK